MTNKQRSYRWGILGTGYAADQFSLALRQLPNATLAAVGSQSAQRVKQFADRHNVAVRCSSYEELIRSDSVDIVYIGAVAPLHYSLCLTAIAHGKPVLCEKPFAMSAEEAIDIANAATQKGVFCMEAMWSRFLPLMVRVRHMIASGLIGELTSVTADFGLRQTPKTNPRLFSESLGGGATRDLGVYPISIAIEYLGTPERTHLECFRGNSGVDERVMGVLKFASGASASILADIRCQTPTRASIVGTEGYISIESPMYRPTRAWLTKTKSPQITRGNKGSGKLRQIASKVVQRLLPASQCIHEPYRGNGYHYQAIEVMNCLGRGLLESTVMPLSQSIEVLRVIDMAMSTESKKTNDQYEPTRLSTC
jgi:predicted dehydrogenase